MDDCDKEKRFTYTGERLVQDKKLLKPQRVENLARFNFFRQYVPSGKILDYGCGTGEGTHFLSTFIDTKVVGIDISLEALQFAQRYYNRKQLNFVCGNILTACLRNHMFDGIISVEVIEHIHDAHLFLSNVKSLLKSNGIFMLTTPNQLISSPTKGSLWPDHVREYTAEELRLLLLQFFNNVKIFGEYIPIYENNPLRKMIKKLSPHVKPHLPKWLRVRALSLLFTTIKPDLNIENVIFTSKNINQFPTLVAICSNSTVSNE